MTTMIQRSFSGGELTPALYARVDEVKYATGARTLRNLMVMRHGGAQNRPGTGFIGEVKDSTKTVAFIPFIFNASQTYMLEFGDFYMRVYKNGAQLTEASKSITGITQANPAVATSAGHGFSNGDEVAIFGVGGMSQVNNRNFKVAGVTTNTFQLHYMDGTVVDSTLFSAYTSGGSVARVYTLVTPYAYADLPTLKFVQSADVITLVHPSYPPQELKRTGDVSWTIATITFSPTMSQPTGVSATATAGGSITFHRYVVTALNAKTGEESMPGIGASTYNVMAATQAFPIVITLGIAPPWTQGDLVYCTGMGGMLDLNGRTFTVGTVSGNTFELQGEDGRAYGAWTSGGTFQFACAKVGNSAGNPTAAEPNTVNWQPVAGAGQYNVYSESNGYYGFIGVSSTNSFSDTGIPADNTKAPPAALNPFASPGNYPSTVSYIQQRQTFSNTNNEPLAVWMSKSGRYKNFTKNTPIQDDDSVKFTIAGTQVNGVRDLLELGVMLAFTEGSEWAVEGDVSGIIKPTSVNPKQQSRHGISTLKPIVVEANALYVQARGYIIRDLGFQFQTDTYRGDDLTVFSTHLFEGFSIVDWTYQETPNSIVWAVRNDGALLGLTYIREQQMLAWHRHDTDGFVENVCCIPENNRDVVYLVVRRTINGQTKRYIERMHDRTLGDVIDYKGMDCSLSYDGRNTNTGLTMTLSGGSGSWDYTQTLTLTSSSSYFTSANVGDQIQLTGPDGTLIRFNITGYTSGTVVTGSPHKDVPVSMQGVATSTWTRAVKTVTGLWHIEGKKLAVFADRFVVGSPNNAACTVYTVQNGSVTFDKPYGVIHAGLPFISDLQTLDIDTAQGETLTDKKKLMNRVTVSLQDSRGLWAGGAPPTNDAVDPLERLNELKIRNSETYDQPVALQTGSVPINIQTTWNSNGRVFIRQVDPLPISILAVAPAGYVPVRA